MTRDDAERLMRANGWLLIPAPCGRTTYVIFPWFGTAVRDHYRTYRFAVRRDDDMETAVRRQTDTYAQTAEQRIPALSDSEDEERQAKEMRQAVADTLQRTLDAFEAQRDADTRADRSTDAEVDKDMQNAVSVQNVADRMSQADTNGPGGTDTPAESETCRSAHSECDVSANNRADGGTQTSARPANENAVRNKAARERPGETGLGAY